MKISKKSLYREALERLYKYYNRFKLEISGITYNIIICLDESTANKYTAYRKRG